MTLPPPGDLGRAGWLLLALLVAVLFATGALRFGIAGQWTWFHYPLRTLPLLVLPLLGLAALLLPALPRLLALPPRRFAGALWALALGFNLGCFLLHYDGRIVNDLPRQWESFLANEVDCSYLHEAQRIESLPEFIRTYRARMPELLPPHNPQQPPLKAVLSYLLLHALGRNAYPLALLALNSLLPAAVFLLTRNRGVALCCLLLPQFVIFAVTFDATAALLVALLLVAYDRGSRLGQFACLLLLQYLSFSALAVAVGLLLLSVAERRPPRAALMVFAPLILLGIAAGALLDLDYFAMMRSAFAYQHARIFPVYRVPALAALWYLPAEYLVFTFLPLLGFVARPDGRRLAVAGILLAGLLVAGHTVWENARTWLFLTPFFLYALARLPLAPRWLAALLAVQFAQVLLFKLNLGFYSY